MTSITKSIEFAYGHRIANHAGKCKNVHGHNAKLGVTLVGPLHPDGQTAGMVADFSELGDALKYVKDQFDHYLIVDQNDKKLLTMLWFEGCTRAGTDAGILYTVPDFGKVLLIDGPPTAERLAQLCYNLLRSFLYEAGVREAKVARVYFWETSTSCAVYEHKD